jgi:hypothetical protein
MRVERHLADCNWGLIAVNGGLPRDRFANRNGHYGHVLHFSKLSPTVERKRKLFEKINDTKRGARRAKWPQLPTTKTAQQYMDAWRRKTPRGQLGFPKTRDELREIKEFDLKTKTIINIFSDNTRTHVALALSIHNKQHIHI